MKTNITITRSRLEHNNKYYSDAQKISRMIRKKNLSLDHNNYTSNIDLDGIMSPEEEEDATLPLIDEPINNRM